MKATIAAGSKRFGEGNFRLALTALALIFASAVASAQLASDEVPRERTIATRQQIETEIENSRYRLGPFYILPLLSIRNFGYDNNVFGVPKESGVSKPVSDWTADVSAGARILQRLGSKMYVRIDALPEYSWYLNLAERRRFGGFYRGAWIGIFNRINFELDGVTSTGTSILSTETLALIREQFRSGTAGVEVNVASPVDLFVKATAQEHRFFTDSETPAEIQNASALNRDDKAGRAGLRVRVRHNLDLTGVVEETRTHFTQPGEAVRGDNRSTGYLGGLHYSAQRLFVNLAGGLRQGEGDNGSSFPKYSTGTGSYFVSFFATKRLELQAYGSRSTGYGLTLENPYYFDTTNGGAVNVGVARRLTLRAFGQYGISDYPVPVSINTGVSTIRKDETLSYGGGFSLSFLKHAALTTSASNSRRLSNIPGLTRTVFQFTSSVSLQGDFTR